MSRSFADRREDMKRGEVMARLFGSRGARLLLVVVGSIALARATPVVAQVPSVGVSTVRSQRFVAENLLGFYRADPGDLFAHTLATGDFNGDGADDLATCVLNDAGLVEAPIPGSGSVVVRSGIPGAGLASNLASTVLRQVPYMNPPEEGDFFSEALASCDFNGDGFDDLAVGVPLEDHVGREDTGAVQVHYGSSAGLNFNPEGFFAQSSPGIPGDAEESDGFGFSLACGDFDSDGFADLVVGVPHEGWGFVLSPEGAAGMVVIVPGSAFGLDTQASTYLTQDVEGVGGEGERGDFFGWSLASGDLNGDGFADLAVGARGEDDGRGAIHVFFGNTTGITPVSSLFWMETFIGGSSEDGDAMGVSLVSADFDGDGFDDLGVGIPGDDLGFEEQEQAAGRVAVLYGGRIGLVRERTQFWTEFDILGAPNSEDGDEFGGVLAAGDFDKDGFADLVITHRAEDLSTTEEGAATILMGSAEGLRDARTREIASGLEGFPGPSGQNEQHFAWSLTTGDFDGDGHADLVLGAFDEDVAALPNAGAETVLYGSLFADGVDNGDTSFWSQTVGSPTGNRVEVNNAARLGPANGTGRFGMSVVMPGGRSVGMPAFVRVGPERGFANERVLRGSFFIDPQSLAIAPVTDQNFFQFMAFQDGVGPTARTRLAFDLLGNSTSYALVASSFNEVTNALQIVTPAVLAPKNSADGRNIKIDYEWRAGNPGQLTVWRTFFSTGVPAPSGKVQLFSVALPNTTNAVINSVSIGMVTGQDSGTNGQLFLDEISFRR
jgi:hypothetical protein